jgi:23S rRNA (guanine2445-N2)-methyltransferase / 23S rRNA (guanine2069-N7)-methyltransferase
MPPRLPLFATAARGTEDLLADELAELGAVRIRRDPGGVRFHANLGEALRISLWTRLAMRILWPLGEGEAPGSEGLYALARAIPWEEHLTPATTFAVEASLQKSEHAHSGFVALKIKDAIADRMRARAGKRPDVETRTPDVRVVAHLAGTRLQLGLDLVGESLNRRGYRVRQTPAPLKETLAAAVLRAAGFQGDEPVLDPLCGSGTLLIEAAWMAARRAPSLDRTFAVERWPQLGPVARPLLAELRAEARAAQRPVGIPLWGFDRDEEALAVARACVRAAGLAGAVQLRQADATGPLPLPPDAHGLWVANPPYGDRLASGGQKGMKSFYFRLGERFDALGQFRAAVLAGNPAFESAFHHRPTARRALWNGAIPCTLLTYPVPAAAHAPPRERPRGARSEPSLHPPHQAPDVAPVGPEDGRIEDDRQPHRQARARKHARRRDGGRPSEE